MIICKIKKWFKKWVRKKKGIIKIIKNDSNKEDYTFISNDNILNNVNNIKDNESTTTNSEKKFGKNLMIELKKRFIQRKNITKAERFLGKSLQGHSPI